MKTRNDVELIDACQELLNAIKDKSKKFPNEDMKGMILHYSKLEQLPVVPPIIIDFVKQRNNGTFDVSQIPFIVNTELNVSYPLLAFLASFCGENPEAITAVLGAYAVVFYSQHPRNEKLTLKACYDLGLQDILSPQEIFPYAMNFKGKDNNDKMLFDLMTPEDLYIYK